MKDWIKKPLNIFFIVSALVSAVCVTIGGINLKKYLLKGINMLQLKASITELVVYGVLVLGGLIWFIIAWRIRWNILVMSIMKENDERLRRIEEKLAD